MSKLQRLAAILNSHSFDTVQVDDRLYAATSSTKGFAIYDEWTDVTDFSVKSLYMWIGY